MAQRLKNKLQTLIRTLDQYYRTKNQTKNTAPSAVVSSITDNKLLLTELMYYLICIAIMLYFNIIWDGMLEHNWPASYDTGAQSVDEKTINHTTPDPVPEVSPFSDSKLDHQKAPTLPVSPEPESTKAPSVKQVPRRIYPPMEDLRLIKRPPYTDWKPSFPSAPPVVEKHDVCTPAPENKEKAPTETPVSPDDDAYQAMMDDCVHRLIMEEELEEKKNDAPSEPSKPTPEKKPTVKLRLRKGSSTKVPMVARIPSALDEIPIKKDEKQT